MSWFKLIFGTVVVGGAAATAVGIAHALSAERDARPAPPLPAAPPAPPVQAPVAAGEPAHRLSEADLARYATGFDWKGLVAKAAPYARQALDKVAPQAPPAAPAPAPGPADLAPAPTPDFYAQVPPAAAEPAPPALTLVPPPAAAPAPAVPAAPVDNPALIKAVADLLKAKHVPFNAITFDGTSVTVKTPNVMAAEAALPNLVNDVPVTAEEG
jgi:hypothetical protein